MKFNDFLVASLFVGLISFGGGKAFIPVYERVYVKEHKLISHDELQEYVGYSIAFPGPISPMLTGIVGFQKFGLVGFFIGILFLSIPPLLLVCAAYSLLKRWQDTSIFKFINMYLQAVILAVLFSVVIDFLAPHIMPAFYSLSHHSPLKLLLYIVDTLCWLSFLLLPASYNKVKLSLLPLGTILLLYLVAQWDFSLDSSRNLFIYIFSIIGSLIALIRFRVHPFILIVICAIIGILFIHL